MLNANDYKHYVDAFNAADVEDIVNVIPNAGAWEWMAKNVPRSAKACRFGVSSGVMKSGRMPSQTTTTTCSALPFVDDAARRPFQLKNRQKTAVTRDFKDIGRT